MQIILARHGQTDLNLKKCYYGSLDVSINQQGQFQAQSLAHQLSQTPIDILYTSTLRRSQETAAIFRRYHRLSKGMIPTHSVAGLNERHFGTWEGLSADQVAQADPVNWNHFLQAPFQAQPHLGEAFDSFKHRTLSTFQDIINNRQDNETIMIIGHLGGLRLIIQEFFQPDLAYWDIECLPDHARIFDFRKEEYYG